ncbi:MAG: hypothetical protein J5777_07690 [Clostridiales bacterium]|nr:hypothetical protein [Clostridiales bacterium]
MKHKKIIALLTAIAIMGAFAGCKAGDKKNQGMPSDGEFTPPSFETEAPVQSNAQQAVGKVTSIDGTKITVELGELKSRTPGNGGNGGNRKERPDGGSGNNKERPSDRTRPSGDGNEGKRPSGGFGYTFNATGGNATYDLSGLTRITIENDDDDTADTIEEIKTGDVVVIEVDKDGKVTALTVKSLNGGFGNRGGNGKRTGSRDDGSGNKKPGNGNSDDADSEA